MNQGLTAPITTQQTETRQVADQVQARLDAVNDLEKALGQLQEQLDDQIKKNGKLELEVKALNRLADQEEHLNDRERELDARRDELNWKEKELNARQEIHDLEVKMQETRVADHKEIFNLMLRNTEIRRTGKIPVAVTGGSFVSQHDNNGNPVVTKSQGYVEEANVDEVTKAE